MPGATTSELREDRLALSSDVTEVKLADSPDAADPIRLGIYHGSGHDLNEMGLDSLEALGQQSLHPLNDTGKAVPCEKVREDEWQAAPQAVAVPLHDG